MCRGAPSRRTRRTRRRRAFSHPQPREDGGRPSGGFLDDRRRASLPLLRRRFRSSARASSRYVSQIESVAVARRRIDRRVAVQNIPRRDPSQPPPPPTPRFSASRPPPRPPDLRADPDLTSDSAQATHSDVRHHRHLSPGRRRLCRAVRGSSHASTPRSGLRRHGHLRRAALHGKEGQRPRRQHLRQEVHRLPQRLRRHRARPLSDRGRSVRHGGAALLRQLPRHLPLSTMETSPTSTTSSCGSHGR